MKRTEFLKDFVSTTTGLILVACKKDLLNEFVGSENLDKITIKEAEKWFNETYLPKYASLRMIANEKAGYKRSAKWNQAKSMKNRKKQDFVWVPIDYETANFPCIVTWDEKTTYRQKMAKQFALPILEGLVVMKENGKMKSFLAQIAYDPIPAKHNNNQISKKDFTGWLIKSDWDDTLIEGEQYQTGQPIRTFSNETNKKGRIAQCRTIEVSYQTVEVSSCGENCIEVTVTLHRASQTICTSESGGGGGYNWFEGYEWSYVPLSVPPFDTSVTTFRPRTAICQPYSADRATFNNNIENVLYGTGLATSITGWSLDKADALARSIGGNMTQFRGLINGVGYVGVGIGFAQLFIGIKDKNFGDWTENDYLNAAQLALGGAALFAGGWIAVSLGAVSIGIAVYSQTLDGQPTCQ